MLLPSILYKQTFCEFYFLVEIGFSYKNEISHSNFNSDIKWFEFCTVGFTCLRRGMSCLHIPAFYLNLKNHRLRRWPWTIGYAIIILPPSKISVFDFMGLIEGQICDAPFSILSKFEAKVLLGQSLLGQRLFHQRHNHISDDFIRIVGK